MNIKTRNIFRSIYLISAIICFFIYYQFLNKIPLDYYLIDMPTYQKIFVFTFVFCSFYSIPLFIENHINNGVIADWHLKFSFIDVLYCFVILGLAMAFIMILKLPILGLLLMVSYLKYFYLFFNYFVPFKLKLK